MLNCLGREQQAGGCRFGVLVVTKLEVDRETEAHLHVLKKGNVLSPQAVWPGQSLIPGDYESVVPGLGKHVRYEHAEVIGSHLCVDISTPARCQWSR